MSFRNPLYNNIKYLIFNGSDSTRELRGLFDYTAVRSHFDSICIIRNLLVINLFHPTKHSYEETYSAVLIYRL